MWVFLIELVITEIFFNLYKILFLWTYNIFGKNSVSNFLELCGAIGAVFRYWSYVKLLELCEVIRAVWSYWSFVEAIG